MLVRSKGLIFSVVLSCLMVLSINAQDSATTATLAGSVHDPTGAVVPGASITLRHLSTNQTRSITTDADGNYRVAGLLVGNYEIRVQASGFAPYFNPIVTLTLGRTALLDISLTAGGVDEQVVVNTSPPLLDSTQTAVTTSIDPERIEESPVNSRNYLEFTLLAPGVAPSNSQAGSGGVTASPNSGAPRADSGFTFGGLRPRSNSISIDGLDNTDETTGAARVALSPEIVREFQVVNNGLSAEFGGAAGGAINVITRVGQNQFHGDVFTFFQNEWFNAREPYSDPSPASRLRFRRYQPGGALGGPIKKDKLFFYVAAEQEHLSAEDESEIDTTARQSINSLLASGFAQRLAVRSLTNGRFQVGADETEAAAKLTYTLGPLNTLNFRFAFTNARARGEGFDLDVLTDPSARGSSYTKDYQGTASAVSVLSPRIVNDLRFQVSSRKALTRAGDQVGPGIEIVGIARFGRSYNADSERTETREQIVDAVSLDRGQNQWKFGAAVNHVSLDNDARDGFGGIFVFRTLDDFAAGRPAEWRQAFGASATRFGVTSFGGFIQDQWRPNNALTFNLGVRYDVEKLPSGFRTDGNNVSPRVGLAWSASQKTVVRAGFGVFYDRLPLAFLNPAFQKNGTRSFEQIAFDASAAAVFAATQGSRSTAPISTIAPSIYHPDPRFATPYSLQANAGIERLVMKDITFRVDFLLTRGLHLPRTRNINLLPPVVLTAANAASLGFSNPVAQQLGRSVFGPGRIDPRFDAIYQIEDSASSIYKGLTFALNKRMSDEFELLASYTFSKATDDASDFDEQPQDPYNLRAERSPSRQDIRHRFVVSALYELPFGDEAQLGAGSERDILIGKILGHVEIAPILTVSSGRPVDPLTGADEEHSGAYPFASRPLTFARNALSTPSFVSLDLRALKYFPIGEHGKLDLVVEAFNLFNHPNVQSLNQYFGSGLAPLPTFRTPTTFAASRQIRFSIDFEF